MKRFLALLFGGLVTATGWTQVQWSLSDALGDDLGRAPDSPGTSGWVLRVEPRSAGEERTLFHDGKVDLVRLVDFDLLGRVSRIRDLRGGQLVWEVAYDPATALPVSETSFEENKPVETSVLTFEGRVLASRKVRDPKGKLLYTDTLWRWPDGALRRLERDGPQGPLAEATWTYGSDGKLTGVWATDEETKPLGEHREWLVNGDATEESLRKGSEILESRVTEWLEAGGTKEVLNRGDEVEKRVLDGRGNLVESVVSVKDSIVKTRKLTYDTSGRVLTTSEEASGITEGWAYIYNIDGTTTARLSRNGALVREELLRDGEKVQVSLFDQGALFLVETWSGGKLTKESYYSDGKLVRERAP